MSSYLLFFAAGDFDRIASTVGPTEVGVVAQKGKGERGRLALRAATDTLGYYNDYFGVPYALPKLDNIAFPGAGNFGAMENWGAIFYFEPYLLEDPAASTSEDRQNIYLVVAHEVSHMWFGNLVTMRGWDDLWLNEGFASWMETKATNVFHPEWQPWLLASESRESAMHLDARASTHPIIRKVKTLEEAELAFDKITYEKGSQVIRMIEAYVGEEPFLSHPQAFVRQRCNGRPVEGAGSRISRAGYRCG
jgi:aminopeptidase N